jgi:hypothetical protein
MAKGGARKGAGRKKGQPDIRKREAFQKAAEKGIEPIMQAIESASYAYELARNAQDPLEKLALYKTAHELNNDLLPYFHRKMPTAVETKNTDAETFEEMMIRLDREAQEARKMLDKKD